MKGGSILNLIMPINVKDPLYSGLLYFKYLNRVKGNISIFAVIYYCKLRHFFSMFIILIK